MAGTPSDLGIRSMSAAVMLLVAGVALWIGGWGFTLFVAIIGCGVLWEWRGLVRRIAGGTGARAAWMLGGTVYITLACIALVVLRHQALAMALLVVALVVATDVGAYFSGRGIGGPKIAPAISPSKTWAGLGGGMVAATVVIVIFNAILVMSASDDAALHEAQFVQVSWLAGPVCACVAQAGDFFESWMKRRAGVKDSGDLIPGHGGLFDRLDGMLPVAILFGAMAGQVA